MRRRIRSAAWWIAGAYAAFATIWIYFSDRALATLVRDPEILLRISVYKGIGFVAVTAVLLWWMIRWAYGRIEGGYEALKVHKNEIDRQRRLYAALSQINQAIVWTSTREALFECISRVLVEYGGLRIATIVWTDPEDGRRRVVARCAAPGESEEDPIDPLEEKKATESSSDLKGVSPHGDLRSWAVIPIRQGGVAVGAIHVYAATEDFFEEQEIRLLEEAAMDIAFALENLDREADRQRALAVAERERRFSDTMIDSLPGILYFYDRQGRFLRWNRRFEEVSGYSGDEIRVMHPLQFFPGEQQAMLEERIAEVFDRGESSVEAPFLSKSGVTRPYYFTGRRVEIDRMPCLVGVGIDISDRHKAEQALNELNGNLEVKVMDRTAELREALVRAEAADRLKSAFLATMSHELRTPLNSIIGFTGIVLQGLAGPLTAEQTKQLGMVRGSARHLLELINEILDLSKIEAGQFEIRREEFDPRVSVDRVVATIRPLADRKGLMLETSVFTEVVARMVGDSRRLEQILLNLLNNAVKFSDAGGVRVDVHPGEVLRDGSGVAATVFRVTDTGIGIRESDLDQLFLPFRQLDSGISRVHEGTGLGLTICRRLTELLGGTIGVTSRWGGGSAFTVTIPNQTEDAS